MFLLLEHIPFNLRVQGILCFNVAIYTKTLALEKKKIRSQNFYPGDLHRYQGETPRSLPGRRRLESGTGLRLEARPSDRQNGHPSHTLAAKRSACSTLQHTFEKRFQYLTLEADMTHVLLVLTCSYLLRFTFILLPSAKLSAG